MTKFVFIAVIAVLAFALYSIPSHSAGKGDGPSHGANATPSGSPEPSSKAMQNSNGQFQDERKFGKDRAATKKKPERAARAPSQPEPPRSIVAPEAPKPEVK